MLPRFSANFFAAFIVPVMQCVVGWDTREVVEDTRTRWVLICVAQTRALVAPRSHPARLKQDFHVLRVIMQDVGHGSDQGIALQKGLCTKD